MTLISNSSDATFQLNTVNKLSSKTDGSLPGNYHWGELKIHNRINNTAIGIIIAGFSIIMFAFIHMIVTKDIQVGLISTIAGVITEAISGILFWYVSKASKDKWKYFNVLNKNQERAILMEEIRNSQNIKFREKMLEKLINTHCDN